ncbi:DnaJ domain-containing protein [Vibrio rarus]|uniref:DnaJ domain-containing protein n=1 Tax=Vibrio rarus TaxID=413403 RepID=UPI0021C3428E|nr:DnaJ domain-containing protein [Vibrio rarus]
MSNIETYYTILNVLPDSDGSVIRGAYKALAKKYHPDTYKGDKKFANEMMQKINMAYQVLNDPIKRQAYDIEIECVNKTKSKEKKQTNKNNADENWEYATQFYPDLVSIADNLLIINKNLSDTFKSEVLKQKAFSYILANRLAIELQNDFLIRNFGQDSIAQQLGLSYLKKGNKVAALELNKALVFFGSEASTKTIEQIISQYGDPRNIKCNDNDSLAIGVFLVFIYVIILIVAGISLS